MGSLTISNKILDKYFGYLKYLDLESKKKLITKLSNSIEKSKEKPSDMKSYFGAWEDNRTSDEIISEILNSRVEKQNNAIF